MGHEVVERGPVAVGHGAFVQQFAEGLHGDLLELFLGGQGLLKMLVDLGKQPRQVPGGKILASTRSTGCPGAVAVRCMNRQRLCWKYCQYQSA